MEVIQYQPKVKFDFKSKLKDKKFSIQFLPSKMIPVSQTKHIFHKGQKLKSSYLIDIVHNLILKYYFKKENRFNISSVVLKEKYGYLYNYYIDYLKDSGILKLIKNYKKGQNARIYKLDEDIIKGNIVRFKNEDKILIKKYKNAVSLVERDSIESSKILPEIKEKLVRDLFEIEIDFTKAIFFLDSTIQEKDIYNKNKYSVECIDNKHIFYHFDSYGRMHTNFTILRSFIRKNCLKINGEEVFEIDIKNSQPLFLNKVIDLYGKDTIDKKEWEVFTILTKSGKFYQYLMDNSGFSDKKNIKEGVYKVFFGKNYKNKFDTMFQTLFPSIYSFIKIYKKTNNDYKILAHTLQNLESELIFNKIIYRLNIEYPDISVITIHDSIISSKSNAEIVSSIFNEEIEKYFHFLPSIFENNI